jgi:formylmethanofuran dehydrogenase subunit B
MKNETNSSLCPACTLLCDDIQLNANGSETRICTKGESYFQQAGLNLAPTSIAQHINGEPADLSKVLAAASRWISDSKAPLIAGLDQLTTQAQQAAWNLADRIGATIDTTLTNGNRASVFALQKVGKVTATLGEVANRSDLIVFWFCDPVKTHPRLLERMSKNKVQRKIVVVDDEQTATAKIADDFIQLDRDQAAAYLAATRSQVSAKQQNSNFVLAPENDNAKKLAAKLLAAKYGCFIFGQTEQRSQCSYTTESLHRLVRQLNNHTRFVSLKLRGDRNGQSGENVTTWSTGYPFAVNHARPYPRFNWLEHSAETVLNRSECDLAILATGLDADRPLQHLSSTATEHLGSISTIVMGPIAPKWISGKPNSVFFQTGVLGTTTSGELCRIDNVSLAAKEGQGDQALFILEQLAAESTSAQQS